MYINLLTLRKEEHRPDNKRNTVTTLIRGFTMSEDRMSVAAGTNNVLACALLLSHRNNWCFCVCGGYMHLAAIRN